MNAAHTKPATIGETEGRSFWRWLLGISLALALAISLFHDFPAFAGRCGSSPTSVTVASSMSVPVQAPDSPVGASQFGAIGIYVAFQDAWTAPVREHPVRPTGT
jgi:hypothetical protein